jgi:hypothetical protein
MAIKGLDELVRKMKELEKAAAALDGDLANISFDPQDPQSIDLAIQQVETAIDDRVGDYQNNDMVQNIVEQLKQQARNAILERAASARLGGGSEE